MSIIQIITIILVLFTSYVQIKQINILEKEYSISSREYQILNRPKINVSFMQKPYVMTDSNKSGCLHHFAIENYGNTIANIDNISLFINYGNNEKKDLFISGDQSTQLLPGKKSVIEMEEIISKMQQKSQFPNLDEIYTIYVDINYGMDLIDNTKTDTKYIQFCDSFKFVISYREVNKCRNFALIWDSSCSNRKTW